MDITVFQHIISFQLF